jgi:hypothetical protein
MVRLAGIEPTTPWFVAKYSIQLSYSREKQKYSTASIFLGRGSRHFIFSIPFDSATLFGAAPRKCRQL